MLTRTRRANPSPKVTGPACQLPLQPLRAVADSSSCGPDAVSVRRRPPRRVLPRPAQRPASAAASLLPTPTSLQRHTALPRGDTPAAEPAPRRHPRPVAPAGTASDSQHTLPPQSASLSPVPLKTETLPQTVRIPHCKHRYLHQDPHTHALQAAPPRPFAARAPSPYNLSPGARCRHPPQRNQFSSQAHSVGESQHTPWQMPTFMATVLLSRCTNTLCSLRQPPAPHPPRPVEPASPLLLTRISPHCASSQAHSQFDSHFRRTRPSRQSSPYRTPQPRTRCPKRNFGGNQLPDSSIGLSPLWPPATSDLHVNTAPGLHRRFRRPRPRQP